MFNHVDELAITSIRTLSIDAIEKAKSGHPECQWEVPQWPTHYGLAL